MSASSFFTLLYDVLLYRSYCNRNERRAMKRQCNFRLWPENEKRLEVAAKNGLNVSEMLNELIRDNFRPYVQKKAKQYTELASSTN